MKCEITIRSALGILVHTREEADSTFEALRAVLARPAVQERIQPMRHAALSLHCRVVTWGAEEVKSDGSDGSDKSDKSDKSDGVEGRAAA